MTDNRGYASEILLDAGTENPPAPRSVNAEDLWDLIPDTFFRLNSAGRVLDYKPSRRFAPLLATVDVADRYIGEIMPSRSADVVLAAVETVLDSGEAQSFGFDFTQEGKPIYFDGRAVRAKGNEALLLFRDVSEQRCAEACDILRLDIGLRLQEVRPLEEIMHFTGERLATIFALPLVWASCREAEPSRIVSAVSGAAAHRLQAAVSPGREAFEGDELAATAIRTGRFQLMAIEDPRMVFWRQTLSMYPVTAGAAFPLKIAGRTLGALTVFTTDRDFWTKRNILLFTDVAEQIASAVDASESRRRLKLLSAGLESAANAIVITCPEGNIHWANPAFLTLNGYQSREVINKSVRILKSQQHSRTFYKLLWRYISSGRIWHGEVVNSRKDGSLYTAEMTITPVRNETGQITNFIAIIQDITERKQAEWAMLDARETVSRAERLSALGIMAAGIAHEINQPLNSLKVLADGMLYWQRQGKVAEIGQVMENVQEISRQADRIDMIIKHMRSFIRSSSDSVTALPFDINESVEQALSLIGSQLMSHEIEVVTELADELPQLYGSSIQLEQVMINLLSNAMQALDTVDKSGKQIRIATGQSDEMIHLTVSDNGPGINQSIKDKIFDPFFTTKSDGGGMGLGLSIVQSIVGTFGGRIKIKANKTCGAVFQIEFPITPDRG